MKNDINSATENKKFFVACSEFANRSNILGNERSLFSRTSLGIGTPHSIEYVPSFVKRNKVKSTVRVPANAFNLWKYRNELYRLLAKDEKKPIIIGIANNKGGVRKTTDTVNIAYCLNRIGFKVLVIDGDMQGDVSAFYGGYDSAKNYHQLIYDYLSNIVSNGANYDDKDIEDFIKGFIKNLPNTNIDYISNTMSTSKLFDTIKNDYPNIYIFSLYYILEYVKKMQKYDFIFIDNSSNYADNNALTNNVASDFLLISTTKSNPSVKGIVQTIKEVDKLEQNRKFARGALNNHKPLEIIGCLVGNSPWTTKDETKQWGNSLALLKDYKLYVFGEYLPHSSTVNLSDQKTLSVLDDLFIHNGKENPLAVSYCKIVEELLLRLIELKGGEQR